MRYAKLWLGLALVLLCSFTILGWFGVEVYRKAPPVPAKILVAGTDRVLYSAEEIKDGQNVWQSMGGQEVGSVWGHGAYVAPDWTADWLHRECVFLLDRWGNAKYGKEYAALGVE